MTTSRTCGSRLYSCVCRLEPHGEEVAHVCSEPLASGDSTCGGSWFGEPGAESFRIVAYPWSLASWQSSVLDSLLDYRITVRRGGMTPLIAEVPADQIDSLVPGNPAFDALMERALLENPGAGLLLIPQELNFDSNLIAQNLPSPIQSEDSALVAMLADADGERCTVCGGDGCDMFFCYVTEK